jgi:hypothetical protein
MLKIPFSYAKANQVLLVKRGNGDGLEVLFTEHTPLKVLHEISRLQGPIIPQLVSS